MESIFRQFTDWMKEMLVSGIMDSLTSMFDELNSKVGDVATQVGTSPASFSPGIFSMIQNISETVIMPIAGIILTFIVSSTEPLIDTEKPLQEITIGEQAGDEVAKGAVPTISAASCLHLISTNAGCSFVDATIEFLEFLESKYA